MLTEINKSYITLVWKCSKAKCVSHIGLLVFLTYSIKLYPNSWPIDQRNLSINPLQGVFIQDRNIHENILVVHKILNSL